MQLSMTGFGKATGVFANKSVTIEMRSVNSKQLDINLRLPMLYREKEAEMRNLVGRAIERGKIDLSVMVEQSVATSNYAINADVVKDYYNQLKGLANDMGITVGEQLFTSVIRLPEVLKNEAQGLTEDEWASLTKLINEALADFIQFRRQEGAALENDVKQRVNTIDESIKKVEQFEKQRIDKIKQRLSKNLNEFIPAASIDANRFEQEIIYFLEKTDITEEKVRLHNHCQFFIQTITSENAAGRKLGFIAQEMGREINTIGSKANDTDMQRIVVMMKDELEKIKEQLLNIL